MSYILSVLFLALLFSGFGYIWATSGSHLADLYCCYLATLIVMFPSENGGSRVQTGSALCGCKKVDAIEAYLNEKSLKLEEQVYAGRHVVVVKEELIHATASSEVVRRCLAQMKSADYHVRLHVTVLRGFVFAVLSVFCFLSRFNAFCSFCYATFQRSRDLLWARGAHAKLARLAGVNMESRS